MAYTVSIIDDEIVEVTHVGDFSVEEACSARREAARLVVAHQIGKVLADISRARVVGQLSTFYDFNATHYDVFPRGTRIATLASGDSASMENMRFSEVVAANRTIRFKIFFDRAEALAWLRSEV
ncbi:MAG: hypothetical protein JXB35_04845 [Anaerolineae bacterium]|nr:hypothetical protein [Anaerolineae bacterium]